MRALILLFLWSRALMGADCLFISLHPAPTEHFKFFAAELEKEHLTTRHLILDPTQEKSEEWAEKIAASCNHDKVVITDCGDPFLAVIHKHLKIKAPLSKAYFYYDNPEPSVPGGYSEAVATLAASPASGVIFANLRLVGTPLLCKGETIDLTGKKVQGIGYYPLADVEKIETLRAKRNKQKDLVLLYIGGANQVYYDHVIPHFAEVLSLSDPLENTTILFQQHPRAKIEGSPDLTYLQKFAPLLEKRGITLKVSTLPLIEAAAEADFVLYSQSSTAPKFLLAGIPLIQIAPQPYEDILVKEHVIESVATAEGFIRALGQGVQLSDEKRTKTLAALGISEEWRAHLAEIIKN